MTREEFISNWDESSPDGRFDSFVQWLEEEKADGDIDFFLNISQEADEGPVPSLDYDGEEDIEIVIASALFFEQTPDLALEAGELAIDFIKGKYYEKKEEEEEKKELEKEKEKLKKLEELIEKLEDALNKGEDIQELLESSEFSGLDEFQDLMFELEDAMASAGLDELEIEELKEMLDDIKEELKKLLEKYGSL